MHQLAIASNRGPPAAGRRLGDGSRSNPGAGGLLTGLTRALRGETGIWISVVEASAPPAARPRDLLARSGVQLHRLAVDSEEFDSYYNRVSNSMLWPLHVGLFDEQGTGPVDQASWRAYRSVNRLVAETSAMVTRPGGHVLTQDYHLSLVPAMLRAARPDLAVAHFTHCPWADPAHVAMVPASIVRELLDGMLGADLLGFYAPRWARSFLATSMEAGYSVSPEEGLVESDDGRRTWVRAYPLGVEARELRREAASGAALRHRHTLERLSDGARLIVRVERMDPAKNLLRGLEAYEMFLHQNPPARGRVVHFVLACASRRGVPAYRRYAREVAARVRAINDRFGTATWCPVLLEERQDYFLGLAALSVADVVVVNSLRDGMNMVAKEAAVVNERDAALILSRTAGAADDLTEGALLVDPLDTPGLARAIDSALEMPAAERRDRAALLRRGACALPPRAWLAAQRRDLAAAHAGNQTLPSRAADE